LSSLRASSTPHPSLSAALPGRTLAILHLPGFPVLSLVTAAHALSPLSLHDALPIFDITGADGPLDAGLQGLANAAHALPGLLGRSGEHTSELQSRFDLVCRLLLATKNCRRRCI